MSDMNKLDELRPIANEMLGGLHAGEEMRHRVLRAAREERAVKRNTMKRAVPAVCMAALALVCVGAAGLRINHPDDAAVTMALRSVPENEEVVAISAIAAGDMQPAAEGEMMAALGSGARVGAQADKGESLFASAGGDIAMIALDGRVYRMLRTPKDIGNSLLGDSLGDVSMFSDQPSLASAKEMENGLSNVAGQGAVIYSIKGLPKTTVVAAEVDGGMRLFQRVSYAGKGPSGASFEDTFSVRGDVKEMTLSGVGTLTGDTANVVMNVLLDSAVLKSADATARKQTLTVTLDSGLKLQLGVSGDTVCGCGGWSCPEFFEAFEAAL